MRIRYYTYQQALLIVYCRDSESLRACDAVTNATNTSAAYGLLLEDVAPQSSLVTTNI